MWGNNIENQRKQVKILKCPYCKIDLKFEYDDNLDTIEKRIYYCKANCHRTFERVILRNRIGLIKDDTLFELDTNGNHIRLWE